MRYDPETTGPRHLVDAVMDAGFEAAPVSGQRLGVRGAWQRSRGAGCWHLWGHCAKRRAAAASQPASSAVAWSARGVPLSVGLCGVAPRRPCPVGLPPPPSPDFVDNNRRETGLWWRQFRSAALLTLPVFISEPLHAISMSHATPLPCHATAASPHMPATCAHAAATPSARTALPAAANS